MTTSAQVRTAWQTYIWDNVSLTNLTPNIYSYDITTESTKEMSKLRHNQEINFITFIISRAQTIRMMGQIEQRFNVDIRYYKEANITGSNFNAVVDVFETIDSLVVSGLGVRWNSTVDYYQIQENPPNIQKITLENKPVWSGLYQYVGYKNI